MLCPTRFSTGIERTRFAPWGLAGGLDAAPNQVRYTLKGTPVEPGNGKVDATMLAPGDKITVRSGGGGGWGDPRLRPAPDVLRDVREGYVTAESARRDYGVIIRADGDIDVTATERERESASIQQAYATGRETQ